MLVFSKEKFFDDPAVKMCQLSCPSMLSFANQIKDHTPVIDHPDPDYPGELYDPITKYSIHEDWCIEIDQNQ